MSNKKGWKCLSYEERKKIEHLKNHTALSISEIARVINQSRPTVWKEIRQNDVSEHGKAKHEDGLTKWYQANKQYQVASN